MTESKTLTQKLERSTVTELAEMLREEIEGENRPYIVERILRRLHKRVKQNITTELLTQKRSNRDPAKWLLGVYTDAIEAN